MVHRSGRDEARTAHLAYWRRRQERTGLDFGNDTLKPHEVEFVERFVRRGEVFAWIPNDLSRSTCDFIWLGVEFELKSTKARAETIHGRLVDAASRAMRNHGVVKENFLVDLGSAPLTEVVRNRLEGFNVGRRRYRLTRLWVLADEGRTLTQINLRK